MAYYFVRVRGALASQFSWLSARAVDRGRGDAWVNLTLRPGGCRAMSDFRCRKAATEHDRKPGVEWPSRTATRQSDMTPGGEPLLSKIAPSLAELEETITPWICEHGIRHAVTRRCVGYMLQVADADQSGTLNNQEVRPRWALVSLQGTNH